MQIESVTSVAVITPTPSESRRLYVDALGLPLKQLDGDYFATGEMGGCNHFGVWPLEQAATACFGTTTWPADVPIPQMSVEFEVSGPEAVGAAADELRTRGYQLLHDVKREPWGQTIARVQAAEGVVVGISYAPSLHN
jgi:catechol 2,3-dioxygenase-like lactoylglutathione lyase family enzyme